MSILHRRRPKGGSVPIVAEVDSNELVLWPISEAEAPRSDVLLRIAVEVRLVDVVDRVDTLSDRLKERDPVMVRRIEVVALWRDARIVVSRQRVERCVKAARLAEVEPLDVGDPSSELRLE